MSTVAAPPRRARRWDRWVALCALMAFAAPAFAADGAEIYQGQCVSCHQADGEGAGAYPALAGSDRVLGEPDELVAFVLNGRGVMPAFRNVLDDEQLAAVLSHVRSSFGNEAEAIEPELVAELRAETEPEPVEVDLPEDWFERGESLFVSNCSACHQRSGEGIPGAFPALAGSAFVQGTAGEVLRIVLDGRAGMPAFGSSLDNEQLALIVSYVRNAWENEAHPVDAAMVETVRGGGDLDLEPATPTYRPGAGN